MLRVRVQPRASRNQVEGWREGVLRVRVTAAPVDGEANRAVVALLTAALGVRASTVSVARGLRGRDKLIRIDGLSGDEIAARLASLEDGNR
jgi:uncharacterized protein